MSLWRWWVCAVVGHRAKVFFPSLCRHDVIAVSEHGVRIASVKCCARCGLVYWEPR